MSAYDVEGVQAVTVHPYLVSRVDVAGDFAGDGPRDELEVVCVLKAGADLGRVYEVAGFRVRRVREVYLA